MFVEVGEAAQGARRRAVPIELHRREGRRRRAAPALCPERLEMRLLHHGAGKIGHGRKFEFCSIGGAAKP